MYGINQLLRRKRMKPRLVFTPASRFDSERNTIRVFTIAYGKDAVKEVLKSIADATQAKFYEGTPENIASVFKEISTFF
jgi:Ca-activated chloride channel family protein